MDVKRLGLDGCLRIKEMLPSDTEAKALKAATTGPQGSEGLHDSEKCLLQLSTIKDVRARVGSMIFLLSAESACNSLLQALGLLASASSAALQSEGLKIVLVAILAIGNALNQGTYKGDARGFRLSSLSKLPSTRSTDGSSNLLDYLLIVLTARREGGDASAALALALPESLASLGQAKQLLLSELLRDAQGLARDCQLSGKTVDAALAEMGAQEEGSPEVQAAAGLRELQRAAELKQELLSQAAAGAKESCEALASYFGEGCESVSQCVGTLAEFLENFDKAKQKQEKIDLCEQRKRERETNASKGKEYNKTVVK